MVNAIVKTLFLSLISVFFTSQAIRSQSVDPLLFPKDNYTTETRKVYTAAGEKLVTYRSYLHIQYVASPVDRDYQSLNVSVPVKVDDKDVDASNAPILFSIGVGGYMSVNNARSGSPGPERKGQLSSSATKHW